MRRQVRQGSGEGEDITISRRSLQGNAEENQLLKTKRVTSAALIAPQYVPPALNDDDDVCDDDDDDDDDDDHDDDKLTIIIILPNARELISRGISGTSSRFLQSCQVFRRLV